jgi:hypothetical protein
MNKRKMQGDKRVRDSEQKLGGRSVRLQPQAPVQEFCQPLDLENAAAGVDKGSDKDSMRFMESSLK